MYRFIIIALSSLLVSCSAHYAARRQLSDDELRARQAIVEQASALWGTSDLRPLGPGFKNDCSGFIQGLFGMSGYKIQYRHVRRNRSLSESLYLTLRDKGLTFNEGYPNIGDLAFFWNTVPSDRNAEGITHVALVEKVDEDGTVHLLHYVSGRVSRLRMNLRHPRERADHSGRIINDYLRRSESGWPRRDFLAGNLFAAYGDLYRLVGR
jgi:hypothetical protein